MSSVNLASLQTTHNGQGHDHVTYF